MEQRPPLPPFTEETARQKIQMAEDAWNGKTLCKHKRPGDYRK